MKPGSFLFETGIVIVVLESMHLFQGPPSLDRATSAEANHTTVLNSALAGTAFVPLTQHLRYPPNEEHVPSP